MSVESFATIAALLYVGIVYVIAEGRIGDLERDLHYARGLLRTYPHDHSAFCTCALCVEIKTFVGEGDA